MFRTLRSVGIRSNRLFGSHHCAIIRRHDHRLEPAGAVVSRPLPPPLDGITVLDLGRVISGPLCALTLAELGAHVIRIERPGGDSSWQLPPFVHADGSLSDERLGADDVALSHAKRDHGKHSVELDYTAPAGRARLLSLVRDTDVLVENFRPDVMSELGLGYDVLSAANPRLIHCSITGYGHDGPYRDRHGMALLVAAMSGALAKTGFPAGPPVAPGFPLADHAAAIYAVVGVLSALRQRDQHGAGQFIDVSMFDVMTNLLWDEPLDQYEDEAYPHRTGNTDLRGAPVDVYPAADGWVAVMGLSQAHFDRLCTELGRPDLATRFPDLPARVAGAAEIDAAIVAWTSSRATDAIVGRMDAIDVPSAPVNVPWTTRSHPQTQAREMLVALEHQSAPGVASRYRAARIPLALSRTRLGSSPVVEPLGASTRRVLSEAD
jgi:crotonobetainyl-CoA:carnitine CoA-transferase CaiB-like acyl-CoA transferase